MDDGLWSPYSGSRYKFWRRVYRILFTGVGNVITWRSCIFDKLNIFSYGWFTVIEFGQDVQLLVRIVCFLRCWKSWMRGHVTLKKLHVLSCGWTTVVKCRHSGEESIELSPTCAYDVITRWSSYFDKFLYLQLWIGYNHKIWAGGTPLGEDL